MNQNLGGEVVKDQYLILDHPESTAIIKEVIDGKATLSQIAKKYKIKKSTLQHYIKKKLYPDIAKDRLSDQKATSDDYMKKIEKLSGYCYKLIDACDEWLTDPESHDRYSLADRAEEISIIYQDIGESGRSVRKKALLSDLLAEALPEGAQLQYVQSKRTDTRELILKALNTAGDQLELMARIAGDMKEISVNIDVYGALIPAIVQIIVKDTEACPDIQSRLLMDIDRLTGEI